jgi:hypothetical protein
MRVEGGEKGSADRIISSLRGAERRSNPFFVGVCRAVDCFAEPVIVRATRWLAMTVREQRGNRAA